MGKPKAETRIKREREKLAEVFAKMDENKRKTAEKLMDNAAFMAVTLEDLRDSINENGCVSEYQNGENQFGTKKSPEVEVYNTMIKNYTTVIKTLCDLLPESNGEQPGILRKRLDAGIAGDGVPAPENAGNGVQFEHRQREVTTRARGLGAQSRQTARDGAVGSFCFCAVTDGIAIPSTHIEHMGKDTAAHPAMGSPGCVRQSAKAGETGGGEQYGSQNRPQTGERTSCQAHGARSQENTGTGG